MGYYVKYLILDREYGSKEKFARFDTLAKRNGFIKLIRKSGRHELVAFGREGV